jgi:hypothetical protein
MAPLSEPADRISTVARLAAAARLNESAEGVGLPIALRYRLLSPWTNWLVTATRPEHEKAYDVPALRKVQHTLAAGWGGVGTVRAYISMEAASPASLKDIPAPLGLLARLSRSQAYDPNVGDFEDALQETAVFAPGPDLQEPYRRLLALIEDDPARLDVRRALDLLDEAGLASEFRDVFRAAADLGLNSEVIAAIVLAEIFDSLSHEDLSIQASAAVTRLRAYVDRVTVALQEIADRGIALAAVTDSSAVRDILRPELAQDLREAIRRIARVHDLLGHVKDRARRQQHLTK